MSAANAHTNKATRVGAKKEIGKTPYSIACIGNTPNKAPLAAFAKIAAGNFKTSDSIE